MAGTVIGGALFGLTTLLVAAAAVVLRRGLVHRTPGEALGTRVTGIVLGLVVLAVVAAAFGLDSIFNFGVATTDGV